MRRRCDLARAAERRADSRTWHRRSPHNSSLCGSDSHGAYHARVPGLACAGWGHAVALLLDNVEKLIDATAQRKGANELPPMRQGTVVLRDI